VEPDEVFRLIATERHRVADMFDGLDESQWATQSLCSEWTVRDIAGHLIGPFCVSVPRFVVRSIFSGGFHRYSVKLSRQLGRRPPAEITAILRANAEGRYAPPGTGVLAALTDLAVHTRDAAQPLGLDVTASFDAWRGTLEFLSSERARRGFVPPTRLVGLRLRATDQDWSAGDGPEVTGPSGALALAMSGRWVALHDLAGDGLPTLRARLT
jgi:uncharacterized protein (TIGR03083 family)